MNPLNKSYLELANYQRLMASEVCRNYTRCLGHMADFKPLNAGVERIMDLLTNRSGTIEEREDKVIFGFTLVPIKLIKSIKKLNIPAFNIDINP